MSGHKPSSIRRGIKIFHATYNHREMDSLGYICAVKNMVIIFTFCIWSPLQTFPKEKEGNTQNKWLWCNPNNISAYRPANEYALPWTIFIKMRGMEVGVITIKYMQKSRNSISQPFPEISPGNHYDKMFRSQWTFLLLKLHENQQIDLPKSGGNIQRITSVC